MNLNERLGVTLQNFGLFLCLAGLYLDGYIPLYVIGGVVFTIGVVVLRYA
jgi:hypothetical protein